MENRLHRLWLSPAIVLLGGALLAGCVNDDYDFDEVDSTMGFIGGELQLPASSTTEITLDDVLELEDGDCVVADPVTGDYSFVQEGDYVEPSHPSVDRIRVAQRMAPEETPLPLERNSQGKYEASGKVQVFHFSGDKPEEVVELTSADLSAGTSSGESASFDFTLNLTDLRSVVNTVEELTIAFPDYMELSGIVAGGRTFTQDGSEVTFSNLPTSRDLTLSVNISTLNFGFEESQDNRLVVDVKDKKIYLDGSIFVAIRTARSSSSSSYVSVGSSFGMDNFYISSVTGKFNPEIDMTDLGSVDVTGVPDFLRGDDVCVDLANPQVLLTITSDLSMGGTVDGTIKAFFNDGSVPVEVPVEGIKINAGGTTTICICRNADGITGYDDMKEVPNLSDIIRRIPDRIEFSAVATADATKEVEFELGRTYDIQPSYTVKAPIAFAEDAQIVYRDSVDGWNSDLEDYELSDNSYIELTANVENRIPAFLTLSAYAIDVNGNRMSDSEIEVKVDNTILASSNGVEPVGSAIVVKVEQKQSDALERLDGLVFDFAASARNPQDGTDVVDNITLNSRNHTILINDIKVKLVGTVIGDFN